MGMEDYERRIKQANARREELAQKRAEKVALLNAAEEKMEKLKQKAESFGFELKDLPELIKTKKQALADKIEEYESSLDKVAETLAKYD